MIYEQELLEQIADDERDFAFALRVFDGDLAQLKSVLLWQLSDGLIEVSQISRKRTLTISELKAIFSDDDNFLDASRAANYAIRLTDKGQCCTFS